MSGPAKQLSWQPTINSQTAIGRYSIVASYDMLGKQLYYSLTGQARRRIKLHICTLLGLLHGASLML